MLVDGKYIRKCKFCKQDYEVDLFTTVFTCDNCKKEHIEAAKNKVFIRKCIGCGNDTPTKKHRATVVYCEKCKEEKNKVRRENAERYLNRKFSNTCHICKEKEETDSRVYGTYTCSRCKELPNPVEHEKTCRGCGKNKIIVFSAASSTKLCVECSNKLKDIVKKNGKFYRQCLKCEDEFELKAKSRKIFCEKCNNQTDVNRPAFGKKKHFGYYGIASDGHRWDSLNEQDVEEFLIANRIKHKHHPRLGKTFNFADQYLPDYDLHIEIDGIGRQDDLDWGGKLSLYKKLDLKYKIIKPVSKHFIEDPQQCFEELKEQIDVF